MAIQKMYSFQIVELLRQKHALDVAFSEVKNGPTHYTSGMRKLDFWAMLKTWSPPTAIGYEIKVSRSDFLRDDKWTEYLKYCNRFYFVAPNGLIKPEELPPEAGLIVVTSNRTGLLTKKKAPHRDIEIPEPFWRYILMNKADGRCVTAEDWKARFEQEDVDRAIGEANSKKIRCIVEERIKSVRDENKSLKHRMKAYEAIEKQIEMMGFDPLRPPSAYDVQHKLREFKELFPSNLKWSLSSTIDRLESLKEQIEDHEKALEKQAAANTGASA